MKHTLNITAIACMLLLSFISSPAVFAQYSNYKVVTSELHDDHGFFGHNYEAEITVAIDGEEYDLVFLDFSHARQVKSQEMSGVVASKSITPDITVTVEITHKRLAPLFQTMSNSQGDAGRKGKKMLNIIFEKNGRTIETVHTIVK